MRTDIKVGIFLGIFLVVSAVVFFISRTSTDQSIPDIDMPDEPTLIPFTEAQPPPAVVPQTTQAKEQPTEPIEIEPARPTVKLPLVHLKLEPAAPGPLPEPEPIDTGPRYYTVKKGDTLSSISESYYGSTKFIDVIYNANRDIITDRNKLKIGWKLRIPRPEELAD